MNGRVLKINHLNLQNLKEPKFLVNGLSGFLSKSSTLILGIIDDTFVTLWLSTTRFCRLLLLNSSSILVCRWKKEKIWLIISHFTWFTFLKFSYMYVHSHIEQDPSWESGFFFLLAQFTLHYPSHSTQPSSLGKFI